jgi:hypothetical protein
MCQIQILGLILYLSCHPALDSKWLRHRRRVIDGLPITIPQLYHSLLRQGRIWDFHDLLVSIPTMEDIKMFTNAIFDSDLISSLQTLIADWSDSVHGYDSSTTLALLSILTHILLKPIRASERDCVDIFQMCLPLANSVMENDPGNLKSRPYLRVLLAKSRFAETASRQAVDLLSRQLKVSQGIFYHPDIAQLPVYMPAGDELPLWTPQDQPAELKDPIKVVLGSAIDLGDWETEVLARQELIRLSSDPGSELDKICALQLSKQADINGYAASLAAKFLVSAGCLDKEKLGAEISVFLSNVVGTDYLDASYNWILTVLQYKLENKSASTIKNLLERDDSHLYEKMEQPLLEEISRKMPSLKEWADILQAQIFGRKKKEVAWQISDSSPYVQSRPRRRRTETITEQNRRISEKSAPDERKRGQDSPVVMNAKARDNNNMSDRRPPPNHVSTSSPAPGHSTAAGPANANANANSPTRNLDEMRLVSMMKEMLGSEFRRRDEDERVLERQRQLERKEILDVFKKGGPPRPCPQHKRN